MKIISLTCPKCHANLEVDDDQKKIYCLYCGAPIFIDDEVIRSEYTYKKIDAARIRQAEIKRDLKIREMEKEERSTRRKVILSTIGIVGYILLMVLAANWDRISTSYKENQGMIRVENPKDYKGKNYKTVVEKLEILGFENIKTIDLDDAGLFKKADDIVDISINGIVDFEQGDWFKTTDQIIITYH